MKALTRNEEALLCGREEVIRQLVYNCRDDRFSVIAAEPGLGITSLLEAGVVPALERDGFIVASFKDWQVDSFAKDLKDAIAEAVRRNCDPLFHAKGEELGELAERAHRSTGKPIALVLDQFEDYMRCHVNTVISDAFDAELSRAITARQCGCVVGLQEHAIPAFERLGPHIPNILGHRIQLTPLTTEGAKEAVLREARAREFEVEPGVLETLVSAPVVEAEGKGIHPFFLKVATGQLYGSEAGVKSSVLRTATIEARGGVDRIVLESLDPELNQLSSTHTELLFRWCNILISPDQHRLSVTEKGLTGYAGKLKRFVSPLLQRLTEVGLLRTINTPEAVRYEIARDCFVPVVRDWWERREAVVVAKRRVAFRVKSISVAVSALVLTYVIWLIFGSR